jgi:hypothetical protein
MAAGLAMVVLVTVMLGVAVALGLCQREMWRAWHWLRDRVRPREEHPEGLPIERIARDARRLRAQLGAVGPGTPMSRRAAIVQAYDEVLAEACRAVGVRDTLSDLPPGTERDAERLRIEFELDRAGVRLSA